jgi:O-Antigen ligase
MSAVLAANTRINTLSASAWGWIVTVFVMVIILTGGISIPSAGMLAFQSVISAVLLVLALFRLAAQGFPTRIAYWGAILVCGAIGLILFQLVPLPASVWTLFPGRELVQKNFELMGIAPGFSTLSLMPEITKADGIALLPAIAVFLAVLSVSQRQVFWICGGIVACAIASVGLSLLQHFHGEDPAYYLYDVTPGVGVGIFNNRSFFSAQLYTSIPILSAFAVTAQQKWHIKPILVVAAGIIYAGIILVGLSLSQSRSGILLAMPAILFAVILAFSQPHEAKRGTATTVALMALLLGVLVLGQVSMAGLLRFTDVDPFTDYRTVIAKGSIDLGFWQFPIGSGFGSFVPLYQLHETPDMMHAEFVNHAHNDWLELVIEGGAPAILLLAAFVFWFLFCLIRVWRYGQGGQTALFQRMASLVIPLLLIHSFFDFPLRTPALMALFALCCGIMVLPPDLTKGSSKTTRKTPSSGSTTPVSGNERKPFQRPKTGFGATRTSGQNDPGPDNLQ